MVYFLSMEFLMDANHGERGSERAARYHGLQRLIARESELKLRTLHATR
jgi:hypothetical protein